MIKSDLDQWLDAEILLCGAHFKQFKSPWKRLRAQKIGILLDIQVSLNIIQRYLDNFIESRLGEW